MTPDPRRRVPQSHPLNCPISLTIFVFLLVSKKADRYSNLVSAALSSSFAQNTNANARPQNLHHPVPRVEAHAFDPSIDYHHHHRRKSPLLETADYDPHETPVVVSSVLTPSQCETLTETLVTECGTKTVDVQRKRPTRTDVYQFTLNQALEIMMESKHDDAALAFCEGLLDDSAAEFREELTKCREQFFSDDEDWFQHFPSGAKPSDCVIVAGEGATSTLHRDPFEWTGTSLCLEGTKVWRFIPPPNALLDGMGGVAADDKWSDADGVQVVDEALKSYRLNSIAWGDEDEDRSKLMLSAGWQSDFSLYADRHKSVPTAQSLSRMKDHDRIKKLESIASDPNQLGPNVHLPTKPWTTVQQPGDLLLIPAHWWHQTYALEPSLSVASQRCGGLRDAGRVVRHMLETLEIKLEDVPDLLRRDKFAGLEPAEGCRGVV